MKSWFIIYFLLFSVLPVNSQVINYTFNALSGAYTTHAAATKTIDGALGPSSNDALSGAPVPIGFNFKFGCTTYTEVLISSNGWLTFNMNCIATSGDPNNQLAGNASQSATFLRPAIAPLWDDLDVYYFPTNGEVSTQLTGAPGSRVFSVEWLRMMWSANSSAAVISFQAKLYEGSNIIDFVYRQEGGAPYAGTTNPKTSASIGLAGGANGNYYSVQTTGASPVVTNNAGEITTLNTKPATGQIYRWTPPCTTLPIELISFSGENIGHSNNLSWITATEHDNNYFTVERSEDASGFSEVARIKGAGNSQTERKYVYKDEKVNEKDFYYRLKQSDYDGSFQYSDIVFIKADKTRPVISPNPTSTSINISGAAGSRFYILSLSGMYIKEGVVNNHSIDVSEISEGLYILKTGDQVGKLIIQR